jgi:drug/metabolite transporter (DMT)-like permease
LPWVWSDLAAAYAAHWPTLIGIAGISVLCNLMLIHAFRRAEASFLAPFFYIEIPSGLLIAVFFLNETLTWNVLLGAGVIIIAGAVTAFEPAPKPIQVGAGAIKMPGPNQT